MMMHGLANFKYINFVVTKVFTKLEMNSYIACLILHYIVIICLLDVIICYLLPVSCIWEEPSLNLDQDITYHV